MWRRRWKRVRRKKKKQRKMGGGRSEVRREVEVLKEKEVKELKEEVE